MSSGNYLANAGEYLITLVLGLYILAVMLRFLLQLVRADFYNPFSQFIVTITNPALRPLRKLIPGFAGIDWPSILLLCLLQGIEICLIALLKIGSVPAIAGLLVLIIAYLIKLLLFIYLVLIIIQVIISWINPGAYSPMTIIIYQLTEPVMRPVRRIIPVTGGLDWSPLVVLVCLNLLLMLLVAPLQDLGNALSGYPLRIL